MENESEFHGPILTPKARSELSKLKQYAQIRKAAMAGYTPGETVSRPPPISQESLNATRRNHLAALKFIIKLAEDSEDKEYPSRPALPELLP